jgi:CheY-like chemotaxis protein
MSSEVQARLFEPFFSTKAPGKGTGLGLATVYGIVRQSHGQIYVYSEPGHGTAFKIYLPVTADTVASVAETNAPPSVGGSETVLIVEDNDGARRLARVVLTRQGYRVIDATSAELALELLNAGDLHVDLVMTDIIMTGITGIALAQRLRVSHPELRVLFTSGYSNDVAFPDDGRDPATRFLEKPYTPARLARAVREALDTPSPSAGRRRVA